jgi:iron complex transport system ATP-binding protein
MECNNTDLVLQIDNLSVEAWGVTLLRDLSMQLSAGEILAIIGTNGAGKTSLLNTLLGDLPVSKGRISICGYDLKEAATDTASIRQRAKHISMLPQLSLLNFPYRVDEVVSLARIPHDSGNIQDAEIIKQALAAMDITHLKHRYYTQLSGGEKQRVQLARVMAQIWRAEDADPRLLLLDEPTSSLDPGHQQQLMQAIRSFSDQGVAVVIVMHDVSMAACYADYLLALDAGNVAALGSVEEVVTADLMQQIFKAKLEVIQHPVSGKPVLLQA